MVDENSAHYFTIQKGFWAWFCHSKGGQLSDALYKWCQ